MMLERWFVERIKVWPGLTRESTEMGEYLVFRGNTPSTLEGNLRILARELTDAADCIREDGGE